MDNNANKPQSFNSDEAAQTVQKVPDARQSEEARADSTFDGYGKRAPAGLTTQMVLYQRSETPQVLCVIPARYASTRLPGKPLADIAGKSMIQRVYERALGAKRPASLLVATDHQGVYDAVTAFGGQVMLTSPDHPTGTDRLAEVAANRPDYDIIINIQGDEPLIEPSVIDQLAAAFDSDPDLNMATLMTELNESEYQVPSVVKVVADLSGYALYFSRSLIPYPRTKPEAMRWYKHIGVYAYRRDFLLKYASLPPTLLEQTESLEQLRALDHGYRIKVLKTDHRFIGVDTPEDLERVNEIYKKLEAE